jgi:hypothetical protein
MQASVPKRLQMRAFQLNHNGIIHHLHVMPLVFQASICHCNYHMAKAVALRQKVAQYK